MSWLADWLFSVWHSNVCVCVRRQKQKDLTNKAKEIRQIKMTLKHETVKLRPRYWTAMQLHAGFSFYFPLWIFVDLRKVMKWKRIYWFGTFPWIKYAMVYELSAPRELHKFTKIPRQHWTRRHKIAAIFGGSNGNANANANALEQIVIMYELSSMHWFHIKYSKGESERENLKAITLF